MAQEGGVLESWAVGFEKVSGSEELGILEGEVLGSVSDFRWMKGGFRDGFGHGRKGCVARR